MAPRLLTAAQAWLAAHWPTRANPPPRPAAAAHRQSIESLEHRVAELQQAEERLQAFSHLAQQLNGATTPVAAARVILEVADQLMGWDAAYLDTYSPEADVLTAVLSFDVVAGQRAEVPATTVTTKPGLMTRRAIADGAQLVLRSSAAEFMAQLPAFGDTARMSESLMVVPIHYGQQVAGVLSIQSYTPQAYTPELLATLQSLADHAGNALNRITAQADLQRSESRQRYLVEHATDIIYEVDAEGRITAFNPFAVRLLGYTPEELLGRHYLELVHPDQRGRIARVYVRQFRQRVPSSYEEVLALAKDGSALWLGQNAQLVFDGEQVVGFQVVARDVTRRRQAEQALTEANQKLTVWVDELETRNREISLLSNMGERLQACQTPDEAYELFSQTLEYIFPNLSGALYTLRASRDQLEAMVRWGDLPALATSFVPDDCWALRRGQPHGLDAGHAVMRCRHLGEAAPAGWLCVPLTAQHDVLGVLHLRSATLAHNLASSQALALTVVEHMALALSNLKLRETLRSQAIRDPLTGLFNRRYLEETLERELSRAARSRQPFGVIMFDLDHFKRFNDEFGHAAGDAVLRELGRVVRAQTRAGDIACRYGGEEFTLVLPDCALEMTQRRAEQFRAAAKQLTAEFHDQVLGGITISLGVANFPEHGDTADALLQLADAALYQAKRQGRDQVVTAPMP